MAAPDGSFVGPEEPYVDEPLHNILWCRDCREYPPNIIEDSSSGDIVCTSCGLVLSERQIDMRSEWRTFANDDQNHDDPNRVGDSANHLLNGSQLETSIGGAEGRSARDLNRTQNKATESKSNKQLLQAYKEIQSHCDTMGTGKPAAEAAKHIYKLVDDAKALKGKPQDAIVAGCIFIACRQTGVHRTFREIFNLTHVSKKVIGRVFKELENFLNLQKKKSNQDPVNGVSGYENTTSTSAPDLCGRYCAQLGFTNSYLFEQVAKELAVNSSRVKALAGRSPLSIAAACIYMASHLLGHSRTSKQIASVAGVSDGTIKTAYKFLYAERNTIVNTEAPIFVKMTENKAKSQSTGKKDNANMITWDMERLPTS